MNATSPRRIPLPGGRWITADVAGCGVGILLLHGIPGVGSVWNGVRDRLVDRYQVIVPDLLGFGRSSRTAAIDSLWADSQADAVLALLDAVTATRVVVVGHDFGGPVAAHLLAKAPSRFAGLLLAATNTFGDTPIPFPLSGILWPGIGRLVSRLLFSAPSLRMMVKQGVGQDAPPIDASAYVGDTEQSRAIRSIFDAALRNLRERYEPITDRLRQVRLPTRVLWGDQDPFFPVAQAKRTAGLVDGAELAILSGAGHFLPEERPVEFAEAVDALCRSIGQLGIPVSG